MDEWKAVKSAVEDALPFYESISEAISFGLAGPVRRRAIELLKYSGRGWILDSGVGPGVSSRMMIEHGFKQIVGLDPSRILLKAAKTSLGDKFYPVVGVAEYLPVHDEGVAGLITCFSLRDVRDLRRSISEFARVVQHVGRLEIVDIGKPDGPFLRRLVGIYISWLMPIMARFSIGRRSRKNPFRMIIPTFQQLPTNRELKRSVEARFGSAELHEFMLGGLIILDAERWRNLDGFSPVKIGS
jgi:ubiquinone/menaquinone biosynthesis C-methylase UbiE